MTTLLDDTILAEYLSNTITAVNETSVLNAWSRYVGDQFFRTRVDEKVKNLVDIWYNKDKENVEL